MRIYPLTCVAATLQIVTAQGSFIRGITGTAVYDVEAFDVDGNSLGLLKDFQTCLAVNFPRPFTKLHITSATSQSVAILIHDSYVDDNRLTGIVNITGGIDAKTVAPTVAVAPAAVSVLVTVTAIIAANASGKRGPVMIQNQGLYPVYVGLTSGVTAATGICLNASPGTGQSGGVIELPTNTGIWGIAVGGTCDVRVLAAEFA